MLLSKYFFSQWFSFKKIFFTENCQKEASSALHTTLAALSRPPRIEGSILGKKLFFLTPLVRLSIVKVYRFRVAAKYRTFAKGDCA